MTSKHADFVVCSRDDIKPLLVMELDDASHERADRVERDGFLDAVLKAAELPLLHVSARTGYNVQQIADAVHKAIAGAPS